MMRNDEVSVTRSTQPAPRHSSEELTEGESPRDRFDVQQFAWDDWLPDIRSTLVFIVRDDQILLIHKKTGLGEGKVNGPGGKLEPGEDWLKCARREVSEELHIEVGELHWCAELRFLMSDYGDILCHVFISNSYKGEPKETVTK